MPSRASLVAIFLSTGLFMAKFFAKGSCWGVTSRSFLTSVELRKSAKKSRGPSLGMGISDPTPFGRIAVDSGRSSKTISRLPPSVFYRLSSSVTKWRRNYVILGAFFWQTSHSYPHLPFLQLLRHVLVSMVFKP